MTGKVSSLIAASLLAGAVAAQDASAACAAARGAPPDAAAMYEADVLYLPTPHAIVAAMLRLAAVSDSDIVYDLGSGDGRIPIAAARAGARGIGIELDGRMIERARCNAQIGRAHV